MESAEYVVTFDTLGAIVTHTTQIAYMMAQEVVWRLASAQLALQDKARYVDVKSKLSKTLEIK